MVEVVSYYRVSSDEQAQKDLSIPAQRKAILRFVEQEDMSLVREFRDEGESAYAPADKRPGFTEMIRYARQGKIGFILVHKLDRFSRNREESIIFKSLLKKHGVTVKSITEHYDPETPQGFLYEGMIEVINQFYSMNLATETVKGMAEAASRGYRTGGTCPYGYTLKRVPDAAGREHSILVPGDPDRVALVRRIYDLNVNKGLGIKLICNLLNKEGHPGPTGKGWNGSTLGVILTNRAYVGDTVWNRRSRKKGWTLRSEDEWIVKENTHEPIIGRELFERRQQKLKAQGPSNLRRLKRHHVKWLLAGLMKCGRCGHSFVGRAQKIRRRYKGCHQPVEKVLQRYICHGYLAKGKAICESFLIDREFIERAVVKALLEQVCTPRRLAELKKRVAGKIQARGRASGYTTQGLERSLAALDAKIGNLYHAIAEGLDPGRCKAEIETLDAEKRRLQEEAKLLDAGDHHKLALETSLDQVAQLARSEEEFWAMGFADQRRFVELCVEKIEVVAGEAVRLHLKIPFEGEDVKLPLNGVCRGK